MKRIVIFLDDFRKPNKYVNVNVNRVYQAYDADEFYSLVEKLYNKYSRIDEVWFDHDLGDATKGTGYECAKYLVDFCIEHNMDLPEYHIQSANQVGKANIDSYLKSYIKSLSI